MMNTILLQRYIYERPEKLHHQIFGKYRFYIKLGQILRPWNGFYEKKSQLYHVPQYKKILYIFLDYYICYNFTTDNFIIVRRFNKAAIFDLCHKITIAQTIQSYFHRKSVTIRISKSDLIIPNIDFCLKFSILLFVLFVIKESIFKNITILNFQIYSICFSYDLREIAEQIR